MLDSILFFGAGLLDEAVGDPEGWPHPVRVFGWIIARTDQARMGIRHRYLLRMLGLLLALGLPLAAALFAWGLVNGVELERWAWGQWVSFGLSTLLAAWMLAGRSLRDSVSKVCEALESGDLGLARHRVSMIVGRDTDSLGETEVARAALETLAESLCDGVIAPLFWLAVAGLPGLWAFKAASTLDSMVGHQEEPWTHFGWASARLDDGLNWIPARLTVLLLSLCSLSWKPLKMAWRDGWKYESPNAGVAEAALAGALDVQLGGVNAYDGVPKFAPLLGDANQSLDVSAIRRGLNLALRVNLAALLIGSLVLSAFWMRGWLHG